MNDLFRLFEKNIQGEKLFQHGDLLLLAVSGGVDSVVLCELCYLAGFRFVIAHCNFQLRGEESNRDERFVQSLAKMYETPLYIKRFDTKAYVSQNKVSAQIAARVLRYSWFQELAANLHTETGYPAHIVTAHHGNDNVETVLMNFFKGTGIAGMRGMLPKTDKIVRPLLFVQKQMLIDFAEKRGLTFVEDSSNDSDKYTRNYIRHHIIPFIGGVYPGVVENIVANIDRFREVELLYRQSIAIHKKSLMELRGGEVYIAVRKLLKTIPLKTVVFEIINDFGFTAKQSEEVIALLHADTGKFVLSSTHRVLRNRDWLVISALPHNLSPLIVIEENEKEISFGKGRLLLTIKQRKDEGEIKAESSVAYLDMNEIRFPLFLRKWKAGDYFYPLGMKKKKKLSRFFIDRKLPLHEKEKAWVIETNKKIIWVVNERIDERFKVLPQTKKMLIIEFKSC
jgi:tRNA(Ile)-lysidine synthase